MWISLLLKLISNPKNLAIIILSAFLIFTVGSSYYYKQKVTTLQAEVKILKVDNENLKAQIKQITDHNGALRQQIEDLKTIEKTSKDLQVRLDSLKKTCSQTIIIKKPTTKPSITVDSEVTKPPKSKVVLVPVPLTKSETKTETLEQPKETTQEVVKYEFGGFEYEKEVIDIYNAIVNWFNSSGGMRNDKAMSTSSNDSVSISRQTCPKTIESGQDTLRTG